MNLLGVMFGGLHANIHTRIFLHPSLFAVLSFLSFVIMKLWFVLPLGNRTGMLITAAPARFCYIKLHFYDLLIIANSSKTASLGDILYVAGCQNIFWISPYSLDTVCQDFFCFW